MQVTRRPVTAARGSFAPLDSTGFFSMARHSVSEQRYVEALYEWARDTLTQLTFDPVRMLVSVHHPSGGVRESRHLTGLQFVVGTLLEEPHRHCMDGRHLMTEHLFDRIARLCGLGGIDGGLEHAPRAGRRPGAGLRRPVVNQPFADKPGRRGDRGAAHVET